MHTKKISRQKFFQLSGTLLAGAGIISTSAYLLLNRGREGVLCTSPPANAKCSKCKIKDCPLRKGVTIERK